MLRFIAALSLVTFLGAEAQATPPQGHEKAESVELTCRLVPTKGSETSAYRCTVKRPVAVTPTATRTTPYDSKHPGVRVVPMDQPAAAAKQALPTRMVKPIQHTTVKQHPAQARATAAAIKAGKMGKKVQKVHKTGRHPGVRVTAIDPIGDEMPTPTAAKPLLVKPVPVKKSLGFKTVVVPPPAAPIFPRLSGPSPKVKLEATRAATRKVIPQDTKRAQPVIYAPRSHSRAAAKTTRRGTKRKTLKRPAVPAAKNTQGSNRHGVRVTPID